MEGDASPVRRFNLGPAGYLLDIEARENLEGVKKETLKPRIIVILDRSGSMGPWCQYATRQCIPGALRDVGYLETDPVIFITFDSRTERVTVAGGKDPTIGQLSTLNITCRGSTSMASVIAELEKIFLNGTDPAYHILVISDGAISDQEQTARAASSLASRLSRPIRVSCSLIRFLSSKNASPDTRALTCIGIFSNNQEMTPLVDVSNGDGVEEVGVVNLTLALVEGCKTAGLSSMIAVEDLQGRAILRSSPYSAPTESLRIACNGQHAYILSSEPLSEIRLGGVVMPVRDSGVPSDVGVLGSFVELVGQGLKMNLVAAGRNGASVELRGRIDATLKYFDQVQSFVESMRAAAVAAAAAAESSGEVEGGTRKLAVALRAKNVIKVLKGRTATVIDALRQQLNADAVGNLNAQQTADWLRGLATDQKSAKSLAKRTAGSDIEGDAHSAIRSLAGACREQPASPDDDDFDNVSFYSQSSFAECVRTVTDLEGVVDSVSMSDWMQLVGGVGIPFQAFTGNYVDPWQFRIQPQNLFCGQLLAEPDVWLTCVQAASDTAALECPGRPGTSITGVIPLRALSPQYYDLYMQRGRALAEQQCSAVMRRVVACVPYDVIALSTAGVWALCSKPEALSSLEKVLLKDLRGNVSFLIGSCYKATPFEEIWKYLLMADPRPFLTGDLTVTNVLKLVACILRFATPQDQLAAGLRAMYYLECYHAASRTFRGQDGPAERKKCLEALLQIDYQARGTKLTDLFEPEPEEPEHYSDLRLEQLVLPEWTPAMNGYVNLVKLVRDELDSPIPVAQVFGVDPIVLGLSAAAQAIKCNGESDRIDTEKRQALVPDCTSAEEAMVYLKSLQKDLYAEDYRFRLSQKRLTEERVRTERFVNKLYEISVFEDFVSEMQKGCIENREHPGFLMLLHRISGDAGSECPLRLQKIAFLITGRDIANEGAGPLWSNGNFWHGEWEKLRPIFGEKAVKAWEKIERFHEKYGLYKYPKVDAPNRHGHSDKFPSFFALGFKSLYEMQQKAAPEVFAKYLREHCGEKGCCMPTLAMPREDLKKAVLGQSNNNNNNNNADVQPVIPRPQTPQEKTDAKRARRRAARGQLVTKKKVASAGKAVPAKPVPPKAQSGKK